MKNVKLLIIIMLFSMTTFSSFGQNLYGTSLTLESNGTTTIDLESNQSSPAGVIRSDGGLWLFGYNGTFHNERISIGSLDQSVVNSSYIILAAGGYERMRVNANGNVGIGTTSPTAKLSVNGSANKPGGGSWTAFSDERLKTSIEKFKGGLDVIKTINPVWFEYNGKAGMPTGKKYVGTLAQELKEVAPYMVDKVSMEEGEYLTADYSALTFVLVNALKEQQQIIESLQEKVLSLENKVSNEKAFIEDDFFVNHSIKLSQNAPNPFNNLTRINYTIPDAVSKADIYIYDMQGAQVKHFENLSHENNYVELAGGELKAGIYHYALVVDGKEIDTKKLLLTK